MKFLTTTKFARDYRKLSREASTLFDETLVNFGDACDQFIATPKGFEWPTALRVEKIGGHRGIYAFTWSFKKPDGRATFQFVTENGSPAILLRRVGRHAIYREP